MADSAAAQSRRRRWPRWLAIFAGTIIAILAAAAYLLQPARLTAWLLANAGQNLKLDLRTSGPGHFTLRPGLRLTLPGLSVTDPASGKAVMRAQRVYLGLPWSTLRGRSTAVGRIELVAADVDLPALQAWQSRQPPSTQPVKLPTILHGLMIRNATIRSRAWALTDLDLTVPKLADGQPLQLQLRGNLARGKTSSHFELHSSASRIAGVGQGLRIDGLDLALQGDGELPSLQIAGNVLASDRIAIDLRGSLHTMPAMWAKALDSSFARPGNTPIALQLTHAKMSLLATSASADAGWQLHFTFGDGKQQPTLSLRAQADGEVLVDASIDATLSRWPDAWPGLPQGLGNEASPLAFHAEYHGPLLPPQAIAFSLERGSTRMRGSTRLADLRAWISDGAATLLPPVQGTLDTPQLDVAGVQLKGVHAQIHDDEPTPPSTGTGKP